MNQSHKQSILITFFTEYLFWNIEKHKPQYVQINTPNIMYSYKIMAVKIIQVSQVGVISCGFLWCMLVEWITQCAAVTLKHMIETQESQAPHPQCNWPCRFFFFYWVCWCLSIFSKTSAAITEMALTSCWRHFVFSELQIVVSVFVVIHYFNTDRIDGTRGGGSLVFWSSSNSVAGSSENSWRCLISVQGKERGTQDGTLQDCGDIDPMYSATGAHSIVC